jgi:hypothetical protein
MWRAAAGTPHNNQRGEMRLQGLKKYLVGAGGMLDVNVAVDDTH